jgi:hypothetical protein
MQLYWHFTPSRNPPLETIPDNRVYVSRDQADNFVNCFVRFAHGKVVSDDKRADAGEIGRAGETYRPYPFGHETTGYKVQDPDATLEKAMAAGVKILSGPHTAHERRAAIVEFPGGYIAEIHSLPAR